MNKHKNNENKNKKNMNIMNIMNIMNEINEHKNIEHRTMSKNYEEEQKQEQENW